MGALPNRPEMNRAMTTVRISLVVAVPNENIAAIKYGYLSQPLRLNSGVLTHDKYKPLPTIKFTQRSPNQRSKTESNTSGLIAAADLSVLTSNLAETSSMAAAKMAEARVIQQVVRP